MKGQGDTMKWPGERTLLLKSGCKVMLVWNKSKDFKNGSMGTFKGVCKDGEKLEVWSPCVGTVTVGPEKWMQRNSQGEIIGSVVQFLVVLAYGITCHKSQGLTRPAAVMHCSKEFVPGLFYVAIS